tara:strand:- start:417 stop:638 length:222 start_codon:yes stop_codon:yes gene_type:complete
VVPITIRAYPAAAVLGVFVIGDGAPAVGAIVIDQCGWAAPALQLLLYVIQKHEHKVYGASVATKLNILHVLSP